MYDVRDMNDVLDVNDVWNMHEFKGTWGMMCMISKIENCKFIELKWFCCSFEFPSFFSDPHFSFERTHTTFFPVEISSALLSKTSGKSAEKKKSLAHFFTNLRFAPPNSCEQLTNDPAQLAGSEKTNEKRKVCSHSNTTEQNEKQ